MNPEQLSKLTRNYFVPSTFGETLTRILARSSQADFNSEELLSLLNANPALVHSILKQKLLAQKIAQWIQDDPNRMDQLKFLTATVVGLLGKAAVRNLAVSYRLARVTNAGIPRKKDEGLLLQPQQQIPFAIKTESYCQDMQWPFAEMSFIGGLHYDWLTALMAYRKASEDTKKILKDAYEEGFLNAQYAQKICQQITGVSLDRYVFAAALVLPLGKALMASTFPKGGTAQAWSAVMADCQKYGKLKADAAIFFEKKRFEISYPEMTAFYVQSFGLLGPAVSGIRYALEPWQLLGGDPDQYQIAMILSIATTLIGAGELKQGEDLPLREFQKKWMKRSAVNERVLRKALMGLKR